MKKRISLFLVSIVLLASLSAVSYGGHILSGTRTECTGECGATGVCLTCGQICDPYMNMVQGSEDSEIQGSTPTSTDADSDDFGPVALLTVLLAVAWARLRA